MAKIHATFDDSDRVSPGGVGPGSCRPLSPGYTDDHEHLENVVTKNGQQVAIITGGSQGIGAGLVDAYRQRGWAVVANSLSIKPSNDPDLLTVQGDVSKQATADRIISQALDRFGRVDTLVNNAGVFVAKPFTDYTAEDYALITGVNLGGFFWLTQRAIGQMLKQDGGHVVNMSASIATHADSVEPTALTALTKGGLAAVTKSLAVEYASRGIRVNAIAPGITQTPLQPPESYTAEALAGKMPPLGRVGQVSDIVDGVLYLESAPYVTGEILYIDGGRTA
jgi:NAD(P)-dependent dehydrogenase (short-subunit alcohol dehydrogenase family)